MASLVQKLNGMLDAKNPKAAGAKAKGEVTSQADGVMTLYVNSSYDLASSIVKVVAQIVDAPLRVEVPDEKTKSSKEFKQKMLNDSLPMLDTQQGAICETLAMCKYLARLDTTNSKLLGEGPLNQARVQQWI